MLLRSCACLCIVNFMDEKSNNEIQPKAVLLLSGGLDSTTVLALARNEGFACYCLSFQYGQRQSIELERAKENSIKLGAIDHLVLNIGLDAIGGSALTGEIEVPNATVSRIWLQKTAYILFSVPIASIHEVFSYKLLRNHRINFTDN